tara:strand:+ start:603 stop:749 length:147 start_codon:yes stop_codon:yes gene_type:complete
VLIYFIFFSLYLSAKYFGDHKSFIVNELLPLKFTFHQLLLSEKEWSKE